MVTTAYPRDLQTLLDALPDLTPNDISLIERAYYKAQKAHEGIVRSSGEPYFTHCVAVASILAEMRMDAETISAGLLHDVVEDTSVTLDDLRSEFGTTIALLVDGVTKMAKIEKDPINVAKSEKDRHANAANKNMEALRKMLLMMNDDVRVVVVKLADRLHNMRTLGYVRPEKQIRTATETMEIYAPLANRLGIWQIKWELEDLSLRYLKPDVYRQIANSLDERRADRESYVSQIAEVLRKELENHDIHNAVITARPKHITSIYNKMVSKNLPLEQIYDVRAVRVIVDREDQCYLVLGIVHRLWRPIPGQFDDYIGQPKNNFYRSLHTAVVDDKGKTLEVQIRTWDMHEDAEYGIAAHWRYKEGSKRHARDESFERRIGYLRRLMEAANSELRNDHINEFVETLKSDFFPDRVYVFTPKGDIVDLPLGATPVDFAYHIHTEIGHRCRGAKVGGRIVPLDYQLRMGDKIEILTANRGGPSLDWLNANYGYTNTTRARNKIRQWFKRQNREKHIALGRTTLEKELSRLDVVDRLTFEGVAQLFGHEKVEDFLALIGAGEISSQNIQNRILEDDERRRREVEDFEKELLKPRNRISSSSPTTGISVMGADGLLVNMARCCSPTPGDEIIGFITRGRGITVHRTTCPNLQALTDRDRLIEVSWGNVLDEQRFSVPVEIVAHDRKGLLSDISTLIADEKINITSVEVSTRQHIATLYLKIEVMSNNQLMRTISRIECVPSVVSVRRRNQT